MVEEAYNLTLYLGPFGAYIYSVIHRRFKRCFHIPNDHWNKTVYLVKNHYCLSKTTPKDYLIEKTWGEAILQ